MTTFVNRFHSRPRWRAGVFGLLMTGLLCLFFGLSKPSIAQGHGNVVTWTAALSNPSPHPGEKVAVRVTAAVQPGYHIYSLVPMENGPQATEITVKAKGLAVVGKVVEPKPEIVNDANFQMRIGMHEGTATFQQVLGVPKTAKPGSVPVSISVFYMACNASSCLPPKTITVTVAPLQIVAGAPRKEFVATPSLPGGSDGGGTPVPAAPAATAPAAVAAVTAPVVARAADSDLGTFLLTAFGAGLIALITPCVFPLIPVTLAFFTKMATGQNDDPSTVRSGVVKLAALYCLGIVIAFTGLGAVMSATVGAAGANRLAANPWVNLAFGALFIVFALSLLEVLELRPPAFLARLTGGQNRGGGALGVLGMGLAFVIAAFTCTAPFIGTVLVAAASAQSGAQWVRPILGMATFSAALALPFFLLALFPALLARMPKSGSWLSTVKGVMGWLELAAAVKFLSGADQVLGLRLLNQSTILALWAIVFLAASFWLLGLLRIGYGAPETPATPARAGWAIAFAAAGVYFLYGLTGRPLDSFTVAYLPPTEYGYGVTSSSTSELPFLDSLDAGLAQAKAENKPIFIDFTGYTCTNCRWMERNIFPKAEVRGEMEKFVRVRLYTDNRTNGETLQAYQEKTFGTVELPLYAVLDATGRPVTKPVGTVREAGQFADFLRQGRATVAASSGSSAVASN